MKRRVLVVVTAILVLGSASSAQSQKEISILAWTLSRPALNELIPRFESQSGYTVNVTWARGPASKTRVANGDIFDAAIMTGPIGNVLASGQVVISSVKTFAGLKLSVTVREGAPKPDISTLEAVKTALLNASSVAYVDPGPDHTIGLNAWATVQRLGLVEELKGKTVIGTGGPGAQRLVADGVAEINLGPFFNDTLVPGVERVGALPRDVSTPAPIVGMIGIHATDPVGAQALLDFLSSPEANAVYEELNMETVP